MTREEFESWAEERAREIFGREAPEGFCFWGTPPIGSEHKTERDRCIAVVAAIILEAHDKGIDAAAGACGCCGGKGEIRVGWDEPEMDECSACSPIRSLRLTEEKKP